MLQQRCGFVAVDQMLRQGTEQIRTQLARYTGLSEAYLEQADKALYAAKQQGKDQVVFRKMVD